MKTVVKLSMTDLSRMAMIPLSTLYRWKESKPKAYALLWRGCLETKLDGVRSERPS